jgi:hypothetical protein
LQIIKQLSVSLLALLCFVSPTHAAEKVRLSISSLDVSFLTAGVGQKRGFFRDEGLDVELIRMNANISITALSTGDIDYTMIIASVVRGAMRGMPLKVVASFMDSSTHMLIARPEYKSVRELKGKTLAVSTYGATSDVAARMMMKHGGVDPERELKIIPLGAERARFGALREAIVDVAVLSPPADSEASKYGFNVLSRFYEIYKIAFYRLGHSSQKAQGKPRRCQSYAQGHDSHQPVHTAEPRWHYSGDDGMDQDRARERCDNLRFNVACFQRGRRYTGGGAEARHRSGPRSDEDRTGGGERRSRGFCIVAGSAQGVRDEEVKSNLASWSDG